MIVDHELQPTHDLNVRSTVPLIAPRALRAETEASLAANRTVVESRETIKRILAGDDPRMFVVVGPCSIHDHRAALEYARRLKRVADQVEDRVFPVMRVYFEKPRTTLGWKGLINDPHLNHTFDIATGLRLARTILLEIAELGVPVATEMLEPITPQYIADLITVASIGARTTESPTHRQMASGLSMPVGYKNGTDGNLQVAIDALVAGRGCHSFLGIDPDGNTCVINTMGNPWGHLILRGGRSGPNYAAEHLKAAAVRLKEAGASPNLVVDCSHANSDKDYRQQHVAWNDVVGQRAAGNSTIVGLMLESNLNPGSQKLTGNRADLKEGVSITDGCIGWEETESLILGAHRRLTEAAT
jgi:3-deoxy-7-phosphoheptulonate synthase